MARIAVKLLFICICILFPTACFSGNKPAFTWQEEENSQETVSQKLKLKAYTALTFCKNNNMNTDICVLVDMKIHSGKKRLFLWDLKNDSIITSSLCAHGCGEGSTKTDPVFSNVPGSNCTSLGKYKIGIRSYSNWGINVHYKMHGLEETNNKAFERIVVLHSHTPMPEDEIYPRHLPLGYSLGCPVIDDETMKQLDATFKKVKKPVLLWIYNEE